MEYFLNIAVLFAIEKTSLIPISRLSVQISVMDCAGITRSSLTWVVCYISCLRIYIQSLFHRSLSTSSITLIQVTQRSMAMIFDLTVYIITILVRPNICFATIQPT